MRLSISLQRSVALCIALCILTVAGAPMYSADRGVSADERRPANWWIKYAYFERRKEPPPYPVVWASSHAELSEQLRPFQERVTSLDNYRQ